GMARTLTDAGIKVLRHGDVADFGSFRLAALTDLDNSTGQAEGMITEADIARLAGAPANPPFFVMAHWGTDYAAGPGRRQLALMEAFRKAAVSLIVGVHPHVAAANFDLIAGGQVLSISSLGNFLFDQSGARASSSVLEVRLFEQGTFFARLVPIPN